MAAKAKVAPKAAKAPVAAVKTAVKSTPKGLVYSAAQWKAYNKAYSAAAAAASLTLAANRFRQYRLQSAAATIAKANIATSNARAAAIAAFAARMSWRQSKLAHQNAALQHRIEMDMYTHAQIAGRMQFIQGGQNAYAAKAVARTVDTSQAVAYENVIFAAAARTAKQAKKTVSGKGKATVSGAAINKIATAAAVAARGPGTRATSSKASATAKATAKKSVARARAARLAASKVSAQSKKAGTKTAKSRTAPCKDKMHPPYLNGYWILGLNDFEGTCIMTAVANALWHQTGWRLPDTDIAYWTGRAGKRPTLPSVLNMLYVLQPWPEVEMAWPVPLVPGYGKDSPAARIIGFGDHAAFAFDTDTMVSYAEEVPVPESVEEVWAVEFVAR